MKKLFLAIQLVFGLGMAAGGALLLSQALGERGRAKRAVETGKRVACGIVSKGFSTGHKMGDRYYVTLRRRDREDVEPFRRRITDEAWLAAKEGDETVYYLVPEDPEGGVAEIERTQLEGADLAGPVVLMAAALAWTAFVVRESRKKRRA